MKKSIVFLSISIIAFNLQAQQAGRVRVTFTECQCIQQAADDILNTDGIGNGVFFQFNFTFSDKNGALKQINTVRTEVYGDNITPPYQSRIRAGSASPDIYVSFTGYTPRGIETNNNFKTDRLLGEYYLAAGDVLSLIPTIWEWNVGRGNEAVYDAALESASGLINTNAAAHARQRFPNPIAPGTYNFENLKQLISFDAYTSFGFRTVLKITGDITPKSRPVGIRMDGTFSPRVLLLTGNDLQAIANTEFGYGVGVIPVQYNDLALGNDRDHGNYIILLKVEFSPASAPVTTNNPPTNPPPVKNPPADPVFNRNINTGRTIPASKLPNQAATSFTNEFLTGVWKGTMGTLSSATDGPFSFKINNNAFWALDKNGATTAAGSYQLLNGGFTATYYDSNNWKYVFTSTGYNSGTGEVSGNWTCEGPNYYKTGKWIAKKVSN